MVLLLLLGLVIGAVAAVVLELVGLWILIRYLNRVVERKGIETEAETSVAFAGFINSSLYDKQGTLWILEPENVPKMWLEDSLSAEQRRRKDILEITPVPKYARIKDPCLILTESDGSFVKILLTGVKIASVSATNLSLKNWAKKYPIKLESMDSVLYKGHNVMHIYLETSWEKESWCKALRLASCDDNEKNVWFTKLTVEFRKYLVLMNEAYPSVMKPSVGFNAELIDKSAKFESSSKVRQFLKKLAKKAPKNGQDNKFRSTSISGQEVRKISEKSCSFQDSSFSDDLRKVASTGKSSNEFFDNSGLSSSISTPTDPGGLSLFGISNSDSHCKNVDEGTVCLNLLISRFFFDAKSNLQIRDSIQQHIQRALSSMGIPSYIAEVTCTSLDPGNLPPHILAMRVLHSDMNEIWALEIDVECLGGMVLNFETRLEVRELELEGEKMHFDTNIMGEVTSGVMEDFEDLGKQLKLSKEVINETRQNVEANNCSDQNENPQIPGSTSAQVSRWKSLLHSIRKQVSQVPLSLGIKISSLKGTLRLYIKAPPSDQIWFGFTSLPDIDFSLEPFIGDHKITSGHLALLMINRFKVAIRETLVLPNCESLCVPWMLAEKDDWVARNAAPFMWYKSNQESASNITKQEGHGFQTEEVKNKVEASLGIPSRTETIHDKSNNFGNVQQLKCKSLDPSTSSLNSVDDLSWSDTSQELRAPLVKNDRLQGFGSGREEYNIKTNLQPDSPEFTKRQIVQNSEEDDMRSQRRMGTRERMLGLGRKMGEKIEVKRRHIEERGRSFVERMKAENKL